MPCTGQLRNDLEPINPALCLGCWARLLAQWYRQTSDHLPVASIRNGVCCLHEAQGELIGVGTGGHG